METPASQFSPDLLRPGRAISHYRLIEPIGAGGMGIVWKARDTHLERDVALKFLPPDCTRDAGRRERFIREAKAASALNHPNIVTIYDIAVADGVDFIAMEYIRGQPLSKILRAGRLHPDQTLRLASQMAGAMGKAHRARIVHRDIKPANIMITEDGLVKILDFGLAKLSAPDQPTADPDAQSASLTAPGAVMGTVGYMSPEQILGEPAGAPSDVFSIGAVLHEMLVGRPVFAGVAKTEIVRRVLSADAVPPPTGPGIPVRFGEIVGKCLSKAPESRYSNAAELAADLHSVADLLTPFASPSDDVATSTQHAGASRRPTPGRRRRPRIATGLCAAVIVAAGASWRLWGNSTRSGTAGSGSLQALSSAQLYSEARSLLQRSDRKGNVDRAIETLSAALGKDPQNAAAHAALAEAYVRRNTASRDPQWVKAALESARRSVELNPDLAVAHVALGTALAESGNLEAATVQLERALTLDSLSSPAHTVLGKVRSRQDRRPEAEQLMRKAVELNPADWFAFAELAAFYYRQARYGEAIANWQHALKIAPDNVSLLRSLAAGYHMQDRYDEAAATLQRALELEPNAATWANLGTARFFQGQYSAAATAMEKSVELNPNNDLYWGNLGDAYRWIPAQSAKAKDAYTRAIALVTEALQASPDDADMRSSLAVYRAKSGDRIGALEEVGEVAGMRAKTPGTWFQLALASEISGSREQALRCLEAAMRAGYSMREIAAEPELAPLRSDIRYHRLLLDVQPKDAEKK